MVELAEVAAEGVVEVVGGGQKDIVEHSEQVEGQSGGGQWSSHQTRTRGC